MYVTKAETAAQRSIRDFETGSSICKRLRQIPCVVSSRLFEERSNRQKNPGPIKNRDKYNLFCEDKTQSTSFSLSLDFAAFSFSDI